MKKTEKVMVDVNALSRRGRAKKLNEEQINELVTRYNDGETQVELAKEYGITTPTVRRYLKARTPKEEA